MRATGAPPAAPIRAGRNDPCPCGSGRKFKHCCGAKDQRGASFDSVPAVPRSPATDRRLQTLFAAVKECVDEKGWAEAIPLFREMARLDPRNAATRHNLGVACLTVGLSAEAAASLELAVQLGSDKSLPFLVDALELEGRGSDAARACRKLSRTAVNAHDRRRSLARALILEKSLEEAEKELRPLLVVGSPDSSTRLLFARLLAFRGAFEEAAQHLTQAIETAPWALQQLTEVKRMAEADRPLLDRMRTVAEHTGLGGTQRCILHFGLGKAFDDLGEYAEAMRHYEAANKFRAASMRLDRARMVARYDDIIKRFTAEELERAQRSVARPALAGEDKPVFIVGMPRSGTTLVEQILSSHPAVGAGGELRFWRNWFHSAGAVVALPQAGALSKAAEDYLAALRQIAPGATRVTDKETSNFELLWLLRLALPEARIIHCRRDPVDTCLSIFFANFAGRHSYAWDRGDLVFAYRQYERLMEHWRRALPSDRFTEVQYETLVAEREAETRRLVAFCGLEWDDACLAPERNGRVVATASVWQARQPVYATSIARWRRYEPWLGELRQLMPADVALAP
jgi:tetratricopeptide (TPR) repeat protein